MKSGTVIRGGARVRRRLGKLGDFSHTRRGLKASQFHRLRYKIR